jgi:hypothetical protein
VYFFKKLVKIDNGVKIKFGEKRGEGKGEGGALIEL